MASNTNQTETMRFRRGTTDFEAEACTCVPAGQVQIVTVRAREAGYPGGYAAPERLVCRYNPADIYRAWVGRPTA